MAKGKKKKVNPLRRPATAADIAKAKADAFDEAVSYNWSIFFTVMMDKEGVSNETLNMVWNDVDVIADMLGETQSQIVDLFHELEADGVDLGDQRRKVFRRKGHLDVSSVHAAKKQAKSEAILYTWVLFFTAVKRRLGYGKPELSRIWQEIKYLEDSIEQGYVNVKDLMDTLEEENGITLVD